MVDSADPVSSGGVAPGGVGPQLPDGVKVTILPTAVIEEMVQKVQHGAAVDGADTAVAAWRDQHGDELWQDIGHDHVVVGQDLMYLHDAPDGSLLPHLRTPAGDEEIFTDDAHAGSLF